MQLFRKKQILYNSIYIFHLNLFMIRGWLGVNSTVFFINIVSVVFPWNEETDNFLIRFSKSDFPHHKVHQFYNFSFFFFDYFIFFYFLSFEFNSILQLCRVCILYMGTRYHFAVFSHNISLRKIRDKYT